ncbi:unnamed protein product [Calicophoron daubneyi]|uniref:Uncharacterized protein n=1 Tax=Calicophoron daubneyi TaxID=300641 RepID=A0AAV2T5U6_CALDB
MGTPESEDEGYVRSKKQWNTYTVSCYENCGNCCCCMFCWPCVMADLYHYTCAMPWWISLLLGVLLLPIHPFILPLVRHRVRRAHRLEGGLVSDFLCLFFCCWPMVTCQLRDEILHLRRERKWELSYADIIPDTPPWIKPCLKLKDLRRRKRRRSTDEDESSDESSQTSDGDAMYEGSGEGSGHETDTDESSDGTSVSKKGDSH